VVIAKKKTTDPQPVSFDQALDEAKKQGLIESRTTTVDAEKYIMRFTKGISRTNGGKS
jgi:DNA-binding PadR family transcriptional regulator